jgi:hypothetical protein
MSMIWKILRPHYWMLDRRVRNTNRFVIIALILLLGWGGQWVYNNLAGDSLALLNSEGAATAVASFLPLLLFFIVAFAMLGMGDVTHQLYLASDIELLMVAPVPFRTIFAVEFLQCSRATVIPAVGAGAFLAVLGLAQGAAPGYFLLAAVLILAAMTAATAAVMLLVTLLARFLPLERTRTWMPLVTGAATFALLLAQGPLTQRLSAQPRLITALTEALLDLGRLGFLVAGFAALALLMTLGAYRIFDTTFHEGWSRLHEVPSRPGSRAQTTGGPTGMSRWLRPLPAPLRFLLVKEWLEMVRDPRSLQSLAQPLIPVAAAMVLFVGTGGGSEHLRPLVFWYILVLLVLFLSTLPVGMSLLALAQEGRRLALLRSTPMAMSDVLKAKFWATWTPMVSSWILAFLLAAPLLRLRLWQMSMLLGITIWGLAGTSVATLAIGGLKLDFAAEELKQRIPTLLGYIIMGLNLVFALLTLTLAVWLMVRAFPASRAVTVIRALADYRAVGWILSDSPWIPLGMVGGQLLFWAGVKLLWYAAVRRLEKWE